MDRALRSNVILVCKVCKFRAHCYNICRFNFNYFRVIKFDVMKTLSKLQIYTLVLHTHFWAIPYWGEGCAKLECLVTHIMSLPGWQTSANQRRRVAEARREAEQMRVRPSTPPSQERGRVRQRDETEDDEHRRNTRRFRWWQRDQEAQIQRLVDELMESYDAVSAWNWMSNNGDTPPDSWNDMENHMRDTGQIHSELANMLRRHWRTHISLRQLRNMQAAYTGEYGFQPNDENYQNRIYPNIPGLDVLRRPRVRDFPDRFTTDGEVFTRRSTLRGGTRQDGINPLTEHNSQDELWIDIQTRRGIETRLMRDYLGDHLIERLNPEYTRLRQENREPDDF